MDLQHRLLTIMELAHKLDIPKPTLRFWEKELEGIINPVRTSGGQRRYGSEHVSIIKRIKVLREKGKSLPEIKAIMGNNGQGKDKDINQGNIDMLSDRIAEIVRMEINRFFQDRG